MTQLLLHDAMIQVLAETGPLSPSQLADEINQRALYRRKDGAPLPGNQVRARATKKEYSHLFRVQAGRIALAQPEPGAPTVQGVNVPHAIDPDDRRDSDILQDLLAPGLRLVVCGTAVGHTSARRQAYYAGAGNKFWRVLATVGLTPHQLSPVDYRKLLEYGIGLTDLSKEQSGGDAEIDFSPFAPTELTRKIERFSPGILAFNGKAAAKLFLDRPTIEYGLQSSQIGVTRLFVAPSTSGAANGYWDESIWCELAKLAK